MLQCVAVCCSVLQCVVVCYRVFQCAAVCYLLEMKWGTGRFVCCVHVWVRQSVDVCCTPLPCVAVCCHVLQYVAVCCRVLPCVAVRRCVISCLRTNWNDGRRLDVRVYVWLGKVVL